MKRRQFLKLIPVIPAAFASQADLQEEYENGLYAEPPPDIDIMTPKEVFHLLLDRITRLEIIRK